MGLQIQTIRYAAEIQSLHNVTMRYEISNSHCEAKRPQTICETALRQIATQYHVAPCSTVQYCALQSLCHNMHYASLSVQLSTVHCTVQFRAVW